MSYHAFGVDPCDEGEEWDLQSMACVTEGQAFKPLPPKCDPGEFYEATVKECLCLPGFTPGATVGSGCVKAAGATGGTRPNRPPSPTPTPTPAAVPVVKASATMPEWLPGVAIVAAATLLVVALTSKPRAAA